MACSIDFIESVCDVLAPLGEVRSRKMMGDLSYMSMKNVSSRRATIWHT